MSKTELDVGGVRNYPYLATRVGNALLDPEPTATVRLFTDW